jgi:hypothetical protein
MNRMGKMNNNVAVPGQAPKIISAADEVVPEELEKKRKQH